MFFTLLAVNIYSTEASAEPTKICIGKVTETNCKNLPTGYTVGTIGSTGTYDVLFDGFDATAKEITQANFLLIVKAASLSGTKQKLSVVIDTVSQTISAASYSAIDLSVTYVPNSEENTSPENRKLMTVNNLVTYTDLTLSKGSHITVGTEGCSLTFTKLTIDSADMIAQNLAFVGTNALTLNDPNLKSLTAEATKVSIVGTSSASFLNTEKFTPFIVDTTSPMVELKGTVVDASKGLKLNILEGEDATLVLCSTFENAKKDSKYIWEITKTGNAKLMVAGVKDGDSYFPTGTEKVTYPPSVANLYCVGGSGECTDGEKLSADEVRFVFEAEKPEKVVLKVSGSSGASATALELKYKFLSKKSFEIYSGEAGKNQKIKFHVEHLQSGVGKSQTFKNLDLEFTPSDAPADNKFNTTFGSLVFESCKFNSGSSSTKLLNDVKYFIKATSFVSDAVSLSTLPASVNVIASDEYTVKDATISKAVFAKDGITLSVGKEETPATPAKLLALPTATIPSYAIPEKNPLVLNIPASGFVLEAAKEGEIPKFKLDVSGNKEKVEFKFEGKGWNGYDLVLENGNTEVKATFDPETGSAPTVKRTGDAIALLNDVEIPKVVTTAETPKGGLSGGAIAGIVIACVVVVAAIAVGVFFVIKKKKQQVAN